MGSNDGSDKVESQKGIISRPRGIRQDNRDVWGKGKAGERARARLVDRPLFPTKKLGDDYLQVYYVEVIFASDGNQHRCYDPGHS